VENFRATRRFTYPGKALNQTALKSVMNKENILADLQKNTQELVKSLERFSNEQFNQKPSAEQWSAANVAEHLLLIDRRINAGLVEGSPATRQADLKLAPIKERLGNREVKLTAPEFIKPTEGLKDKEVMIRQIKEEREKMSNTIRALDPSENLNMKHHALGEMTRMEWVYFIIHHTERHLRQLEEIKTSV
jgi:hypothetical protein